MNLKVSIIDYIYNYFLTRKPGLGYYPEKKWDQRLGRDLGAETVVTPWCGLTNELKLSPSPSFGCGRK